MQATPTTTYAGIDWSWQHHALCLVDDQRRRIDEATVPHSRPGLAKITTLLRRHDVTRVGIERGDGPVVEHLIRDGFRGRGDLRAAGEVTTRPIRVCRQQGRSVRCVRPGRRTTHRCWTLGRGPT
jgi:hypothetical protein